MELSGGVKVTPTRRSVEEVLLIASLHYAPNVRYVNADDVAKS